MAASIKYFYYSLLLALLTASLQLFAASMDLGPSKELFKVKKVEIEGLKKVEKEAVLEKLSVKEGQSVDNYAVRKDIEKIYNMKYFDSVSAYKTEDETLTFKVKERPIITDLKLEGNDDIDTDDLTALLKSKQFAILDINSVMADVQAIQKHYEDKGYYLASVDYEIKKINDENIDLTFRVREFQKVRVKQVTFLGNSALSDEQIRDIMETKEEGLFSFMSGSGSFKEFNFQTDIERIKYFYKNKGYLQVNVGTPEITVSEDKKWVFITIKVNEGPQFTVNDITFQGEVLFSEEVLQEKIATKKEKTYSEEGLQKDIQTLTEMYQDQGYAFANVLRVLNVVPGENKVDIEFSFEKGKIAYFGQFFVKGNTKTRDKVILRELKIQEGQKFSGSAMRLSKENVNRLGFFEPNSVTFNTITRKDRDDLLDVEISVKERNTGQITMGAGYSTASGGFLQGSIAQNNFRGLGQNLSFSVYLGKTSKTFNLGFTEPYLFDSKWTAGGDLFKTENSASSSYSYKTQGFDLRVGYPIFEYTRLYGTYKYEETDINAVNDPTIDTTLENGITSSVSSNLVFDKRNNSFEPTAGHYGALGLEYAGVGGDKKWIKSDVEGRYYYNIVGDLVFRSRLYAARLDEVQQQRIPRTQKFTLGGARNLRGYTYEAIGPLKQVTDNRGIVRTFNEGGMFTTYTTFELEHPLAREANLKWVLFYDVGNIYDKYLGENGNYKLKADYGFGFRWFSPIGVLRFEFGYPIKPSPRDDGMQFNFDIGPYF